MLSASNSINTGGNKSFTYNILNLPATATFATGSATFAYDAAGNKLRKASTAGSTTTYTDYINGIQYSGTSSESIAFIQTEEGKAVPYGTTGYDYTYYLGDNLGNTRVTFDTKNGYVESQQVDDYYPFGLEINRTPYTPKNEYLYNKKELQPEFSDYDYGARFYDPVIGRWNTVDPLIESNRRFSGYNYVMDNPIRLIDPDGMKPDSTAEQDAAFDARIAALNVSAHIGASAGNFNGSDINANDDEQQTGKGDTKQLGSQKVSASYIGTDVTVDNGSADPGKLMSYEPDGLPIQYNDGTLQNYTLSTQGFPDAQPGTAAVFTDRKGNLTVFPGVNFTSALTEDGGGWTPGTKTIHLSDKNGINGLIDLEHEYGHFLDSRTMNLIKYTSTVSIPSIQSARINPLEIHLQQSYEMRATRLAIAFFGPNSAIAARKSLYTKHLNDQ